MRTAAAWIDGIVSFVGSIALSALLGNAIGVPTQLYFDETIVVASVIGHKTSSPTGQIRLRGIVNLSRTQTLYLRPGRFDK